ncbi:MAG: tail fiber domain-containing protein [Clostridia bacterium]|nr:tail fiber domain-containing protein [Clostridia bacterium]
MKYIIVVDKQSRTNPSSEKRETTIEIDELLRKGEVHDDFTIENNIAKVIRRLGLSEYNETYLLDNEVVEELGEIKIKLFEGDNYIYIKDEYNNNLCAEYIVKSDFTDSYVTKIQMSSAIEESARQINLSVTQTLENYSTTEETKALIKLLSDQIALELTKKVNDEELTGASIILRINENTSSAKISADMITLTANDVLNILANNEINFTTKNMTLKSTNFSVDKNGNITATSGKIGGFTLGSNKFSTTINGIYDYNLYDACNIIGIIQGNINTTSITSSLYNLNGDGTIDTYDALDIIDILNNKKTNTKQISGTFELNTTNPKNFICIKNGGNLAVSIGVGGINTHMLTAQNIVCSTSSDVNSFNGVSINGTTGVVHAKNFNNTSLESIKKNITKFGDALEIIKNSEIYEYNFKTEKDTDKKHVGFVIGDKYNTPSTVKSSTGEAIESYTMSSINWRGLQQTLEIIEDLNKRLLILEDK